MNDYKNLVVTTAIEALRDSGYSNPESLLTMFERIYQCGYNEAERKYEVLQKTGEQYERN